jgi:hypothetical protein
MGAYLRRMKAPSLARRRSSLKRHPNNAGSPRRKSKSNKPCRRPQAFAIRSHHRSRQLPYRPQGTIFLQSKP